MAQRIDTRFQEKATSKPLNQRFLDITGPCILQGFRVLKGTSDFSLTLDKDTYLHSVAVSPSGARVEESENVIDAVTIRPNDLPVGVRVDSVYLKYEFGRTENIATYVVVEGTNIPAENPNKLTHLLLAYVFMQPNGAAVRNQDIISMPYGFSNLMIAGSSIFHGPAIFKDDVTIEGNLIVKGESGGGGNASPTFVERLPAPIIATAGQTDFFLPTPYTMNTKTLFVYKNGDILPPSEWMELTPLSFRLFQPAVAGDKIWAFWYRGLNIYTIPDHNHDDLYYRKYEIANRAVRYVTDFFSGSVGRRITHGLNLPPDNYHIVGCVPVEKTADVGFISVEKRNNEMIVYNTGTYRGKFDLSYILKAPYPEMSKDYQALDWTTESNRWNENSSSYEEVIWRRRDGSFAMKSTMTTPDTKGRLTRVRIETYNGDGSGVITTATWALTYDENGIVRMKSRIS